MIVSFSRLKSWRVWLRRWAADFCWALVGSRASAAKCAEPCSLVGGRAARTRPSVLCSSLSSCTFLCTGPVMTFFPSSCSWLELGRWLRFFLISSSSAKWFMGPTHWFNVIYVFFGSLYIYKHIYMYICLRCFLFSPSKFQPMSQ